MQNVNKKLKSKRGFTLVELVVVIAVLAILAGVGSVAYSGYITKANDASDLSLLAAIKTAADSAGAANNPNFIVTDIKIAATDGKISGIHISDSTGVKIKISIDSTSNQIGSGGENDTNFKTFIGTQTFTFKGTYKGGAQWTTDDGWKATTVSLS